MSFIINLLIQRALRRNLKRIFSSDFVIYCTIPSTVSADRFFFFRTAQRDSKTRVWKWDHVFETSGLAREDSVSKVYFSVRSTILVSECPFSSQSLFSTSMPLRPLRNYIACSYSSVPYNPACICSSRHTLTSGILRRKASDAYCHLGFLGSCILGLSRPWQSVDHAVRTSSRGVSHLAEIVLAEQYWQRQHWQRQYWSRIVPTSESSCASLNTTSVLTCGSS